MVALILWFWIRNDAPRLRWLFASFALLYMGAILITAVYPSYGPFFLDWERFRWAAETQSGKVQSLLVHQYLRSTETVLAGKPLFVEPFMGIAAFPSLHVGHMVMIAFVGWSTARLFSIYMIVVALITTLATLAFGWHYLIDAVFGAVMAVAIPLLIRSWFRFDGCPPSGAARPREPALGPEP
jgi:hypothetical protein